MVQSRSPTGVLAGVSITPKSTTAVPAMFVDWASAASMMPNPRMAKPGSNPRIRYPIPQTSNSLDLPGTHWLATIGGFGVGLGHPKYLTEDLFYLVARVDTFQRIFPQTVTQAQHNDSLNV